MITKIQSKPTKKNRILIISDLHSPFIHHKALTHCKRVYKMHKCNKVIFIGDLLDNSATSRYVANPDGFSPTRELKLAIKKLEPWYKAFPKATIIIGNHDRRIIKKLHKGAISSMWFKSFSEVLQTPKWVFVDDIIIDNVRYLHGDGCFSTIQSLLHSATSIVFGHFHSKFEIIYTPNKFAMCVGWLGDDTKYPFEYGRHYMKKSILGCGVVLNGKPLLEPLNI